MTAVPTPSTVCWYPYQLAVAWTARGEPRRRGDLQRLAVRFTVDRARRAVRAGELAVPESPRPVQSIGYCEPPP